MYNTKIRNIEIPANLFSNLGENSIKKEKSSIHPEENNIKLTNFSKRNEYRDRITKMYKDLKDIKPIDNEIDETLYFNNYIEKGIVIKPKISSLKQFWTEYRLINNEVSQEQEQPKEIKRSFDNFEELFNALLSRVEEINKYIDELKEIKNTIDETTIQLQEDQAQLKAERKEFLNYKKQEENKIQEEKENLKINFERLQTIIDDLDKKLESVDKIEE